MGDVIRTLKNIYMNRTHHFICTSDGSTSWYLSKQGGEEIQAMIDEHGLPYTQEHYRNGKSAVETTWFNHGMGHEVELADVYHKEEESELSDIVEVIKATGSQADIHYLTDSDIEYARLENLDGELQDITNAVDKAVVDYIKANIPHNDVKEVIDSVMQKEIEKRGEPLTEEESNYLKRERWYGGDVRAFSGE